jgi:hypothetical protein
MFIETIIRLRDRNRAVCAAFMTLWLLQPLGARADQCDDAWARYQRMEPETRAALAGATAVDLFEDDPAKRQKNKCDSERATDDLTRSILNGARQVEQACVGRHKLVCDVACWQRTLSESEKKSAYDCSPAALEEVLKADQAEKAERKSENDVQMACIDVVATNSFPDLPHDSDYRKRVKSCNANPKTCKQVRESLKDQKWPSDLTCGG